MERFKEKFPVFNRIILETFRFNNEYDVDYEYDFLVRPNS